MMYSLKSKSEKSFSYSRAEKTFIQVENIIKGAV